MNSSSGAHAPIDYEPLVRIITHGNYRTVVLQFADEHLSKCTDVYMEFQQRLNDYYSYSQMQNEVEMFITADSTFGSSIDDISAAHVDSDLIIFFGTDLSSSATVPTVVVPFRAFFDVSKCSGTILKELGELKTKDTKTCEVVLLSDLNHHHALQHVAHELINTSKQGSEWENLTVTTGQLPPSANVDTWLEQHGGGKNKVATSAPVTTAPPAASTSSADSAAATSIVGGLRVPSSALLAPATEDVLKVVVFVGGKSEQLQAILLSVSDITSLQVIPPSVGAGAAEDGEGSVEVNRFIAGSSGSVRELRNRYGGIIKVKDCSVVGLLIGSMGVDHSKVTRCIRRLELLVSTAGKKSYVFVMGRVTETKLCNFPEVDVYVLLSNDDCSYIPPKTFPMPVITPYELEIGLGARDWASHLETISDSNDVSDAELEVMLSKVKELFPREDEDEDEEAEEQESKSEPDEAESEVVAEDGAGGSSSSSSSSGKQSTLMLKRRPEEQALMSFQSSGAVEYFQNRNYKGLVPTVLTAANEQAAADAAAADGFEADVSIFKIHEGQTGVASNYQRREPPGNT